MESLSEEDLFVMLVLHKEYYQEDEFDIDPNSEGKAAPFAEKIIKSLGISMTKNLGRDFFRAYGIIDDHVGGIISTKTAIRKLQELL